MKIHDVAQGSEEWKQLRAEHFCASDAPAMMGASKYKSRNQLLHEKKTGQVEEVSEFKQKLYDQGHAAEAAARDIIEMNLIEEINAAVGSLEIQGLSLLASFDGINANGELLFEHKLFNQALSENVKNGVLDPMYYWQLEHQLLVSGAYRVLFVCSDGTEEQWTELYYESVPERRAELIAGWLQFAKDLEEYEVKVKQEAVTATDAEAFPVIKYEIDGAMIVSNIAEALPIIQARAEREMSRVLETDQDFADKEALNKATVKARAALKEVVANAKGEYVSYAEFSDTAAQIDSVLQKMQSQGEKQVKAAKEQKKKEIADAGQDAISKHAIECEAKIEPLALIKIGVPVRADFAAAMKGKRNLDSLQDAVDGAVAQVKIDIDGAMSRILPNHIYLKEHAKDYGFLFADISQIINQEVEPFQAIVKARIADHKEEEERKAELERDRIREEERQRLEDEKKTPPAEPVPEPTPEPATEQHLEAAQQPAPAAASQETTAPAEDPRAAVHRAAKESFMQALGIDDEGATLIVEAIARGMIKNVGINY
jgi:putative phage-type endonuclease